MPQKFFNLTNLTLIVALALSTVAAYYSIIGLTAIFAGAVLPVIIMGSILEVGKITTTVWLRKYWKRASWILKLYLVPAVIALALLTSMGIFGFLSKAHMDQGVTSGDVQAKLSLYDEKIKTQRDNIEVARKALQQMDAQVDARLGRSDSEQGAERAVQIRRQQASERSKLQKEIGDAQKEIAKLNEERAPIAAENRKVEAEVGPIKYIAALIYGDNADANMLEAAVRWVIILLVAVFDPLAIALVLAANASKEWDKEEQEDQTPVYVADVTMPGPGPGYEIDDGAPTEEQITQVKSSSMKFVDYGEHPKDHDEKVEEPVVEDIKFENESRNDPHPIGWMFSAVEEVKKKIKKPRKKKIKQPEPIKEVQPVIQPNPTIEILDVERPGDYLSNDNTVIVKAEDTPFPWQVVDNEYVKYQGNLIRLEALKGMRPELFMLTADHNRDIKTGFGVGFPENADKGDMFVRVDMLPNKVYKYDGVRWIEINKDQTDTYLYNEKYMKYLIEKIETGVYDIELLSENERLQIEDYLRTKND